MDGYLCCVVTASLRDSSELTWTKLSFQENLILFLLVPRKKSSSRPFLISQKVQSQGGKPQIQFLSQCYSRFQYLCNAIIRLLSLGNSTSSQCEVAGQLPATGFLHFSPHTAQDLTPHLWTIFQASPHPGLQPFQAYIMFLYFMVCFFEDWFLEFLLFFRAIYDSKREVI